MSSIVAVDKNGKDDNDFARLQWALLAVSKDILRRNITMVNITEDGKAVCTDGHRLHIAIHKKEIPAGLYEVKSNTQKQIILQLNEEGHQYPDVNRVIPDDETAETIASIVYTRGDRSAFYRELYKNGLFQEEQARDFYMSGVPGAIMKIMTKMQAYGKKKSSIAWAQEVPSAPDRPAPRIGVLTGLLED